MEIPPPQYPSFPFIPLIPKQALKEVTSGFTKYLEDNSGITTLTVTAEKMEEMLQELFEG
jgi:hypothetical protein